jgi:hypothetical protein
MGLDAKIVQILTFCVGLIFSVSGILYFGMHLWPIYIPVCTVLFAILSLFGINPGTDALIDFEVNCMFVMLISGAIFCVLLMPKTPKP